MAGQVRVLQLDADQELETKLYRLEKGKVLLVEESKVLVQASELDISLSFPPRSLATVKLQQSEARLISAVNFDLIPEC